MCPENPEIPKTGPVTAVPACTITMAQVDLPPEDHPLISKAHGLIETLYMKRSKVHEATERADAWPAVFGDCWSWLLVVVG